MNVYLCMGYRNLQLSSIGYKMVTKNCTIITNPKHASPARAHTRQGGGERISKNKKNV